MSDWRQVQLGQIADVRVSNVDKKTFAGETPVQLCNYMDVYSNNYISSNLSFMAASATIAEIARFKVELGDVLITKDSETRVRFKLMWRVAHVDHWKFVANSHPTDGLHD